MEIDPTVSSTIKIVTIGDALAGKSCAITNFETSVAPIDRQSTIFDSSTTSIVIEGKTIPLTIWDTSGKKQYKSLRKSVFQGADIIMIFFSVINRDSYQSAINYWLPEAQQENPKAVKIFLGNKIDLRNQTSSQEIIQESTAKAKIQTQLKLKYFELSALTGLGLRVAFDQCVRYFLKQKYPELARQSEKRTQRKKVQDKGCCLIM